MRSLKHNKIIQTYEIKMCSSEVVLYLRYRFIEQVFDGVMIQEISLFRAFGRGIGGGAVGGRHLRFLFLFLRFTMSRVCLKFLYLGVCLLHPVVHGKRKEFETAGRRSW